ncbi:MAG TPA: hypothetical protein VIK02_08800 [Candidatus Anoxymicrobiaceae bacterium]
MKMSARKVYSVVLTLLLVAMMVATIAGTAVAGDITVPGTDITVPLPDLPGIDVPVVNEVVKTVVPKVVEVVSQGPAPATDVAGKVSVLPQTVASGIDSIPIPDLKGKVPALPASIPSLSDLTGQVTPLVNPVVNLVKGLLSPNQYQMGLVLSRIINSLPPQLTNIPLVRTIIDLLMSILGPILNPTPADPTGPESNTTPVTPTSYSVTNPTATPAATAAALEGPTGSNTYDHLPYTGADLTVAIFSILGLAFGILAVRRFEAWLIARR